MKIKTEAEFDRFSKETFGITEFNTLSGINDRIRLVLGGDYSDEERIKIASNSGIDILNYAFSGKDIWLRIILWDENDNIEKLGDDIISFIKFQKTEGPCRVLYLYIPLYKEALVNKILQLVVNYELKPEFGLNATCLYFNFDIPIVVNIYDDRGMDVVSPDSKTIELIKNKFHSLLLDI